VSVEGYTSDAMQVPAASSENMTGTCGQIGTRLTQASSPAVQVELTRVRGVVRRLPEGVKKEQYSLLASMLENRVKPEAIAHQLALMSASSS
jgi:hypothetical protein